MATFSIDTFAAGCKHAMAQADDPRLAARDFLAQALSEHTCDAIRETLEAAIPAGADLGEMIVHQSPELTLLYARVPARFRSGIHNHTVFACMGQLTGEERSTVYARGEDGARLRVTETLAIKAGEVMSLPADAIHHIENPNETTGSALHIYGGDFGAVMGQRSLWTADGYEEIPFTFQALLAESVKAMKASGNQAGLDALVEAIPAVRAMVWGRS